MWLNPQETADLVTRTEEILNGKRHFLGIVTTLVISHPQLPETNFSSEK